MLHQELNITINVSAFTDVPRMTLYHASITPVSQQYHTSITPLPVSHQYHTIMLLQYKPRTMKYGATTRSRDTYMLRVVRADAGTVFAIAPLDQGRDYSGVTALLFRRRRRCIIINNQVHFWKSS